MWSRVQLLLRIATALAVCYIAWFFLARYLEHQRWQAAGSQPSAAEDAARSAFEQTYGGTDLRILQFYARDAEIVEGSSTVLCYGVLNARSVRITPPVDDVSPALNRCLEVSPEADTRYTFTAEGADGRTQSESLLLRVKPDTATYPKITSFRVAQQRVDAGRPVFLLAFSDVNGQEISIDPAIFPTLHGAPNGQFWVAPQATTTYTLTVTGTKGRKTTRQLTVALPGR